MYNDWLSELVVELRSYDSWSIFHSTFHSTVPQLPHVISLFQETEENTMSNMETGKFFCEVPSGKFK